MDPHRTPTKKKTSRLLEMAKTTDKHAMSKREIWEANETDAASPGNGVKRWQLAQSNGLPLPNFGCHGPQPECRLFSPDRDHRLESRMREIRPSGLEGGAAGGQTGRPYPYC